MEALGLEGAVWPPLVTVPQTPLLPRYPLSHTRGVGGGRETSTSVPMHIAGFGRQIRGFVWVTLVYISMHVCFCVLLCSLPKNCNREWEGVDSPLCVPQLGGGRRP